MPIEARSMSKQYSTSHHIFFSIWSVKKATSLIHAWSSTTPETFILKPWTFTQPHKKKSSGVILGEWWDQWFGPSLPICLEKLHSESLAPSCWKKTFSWRAICKTANNSQWAVLRSFTNYLNCVKCLLKAYLCPSYAGHLSVETVPSVYGLPGACSPYSRRCHCIWITDFSFKYHNSNALCWGETAIFQFASCVHFSSVTIGRTIN